MKAGFRQSMAFLHTWSGLVLGWLLFAIFLTGMASYFKAEIHAWTRPELHVAAQPMAAVQRGIDWIEKAHPGLTSLYVTAPTQRDPSMQSYWQTADGKFDQAWLDPKTGAPAARETQGGEFFYRFHYELMMPYPWGRWLACAAAIFMLVAIVSGVITHKRIFKDFFTWRPSKAAQRAWLDAHNMLGVLSLPFHVMIAWTGIITLLTMAMPWPVAANYGKDEAAFYSDTLGNDFIPAAGKPAGSAPTAPMLAAAAKRWGERGVNAVTVINKGDAASRVLISRESNKRIGYRPDMLRFDGVTGASIDGGRKTGPALETYEVMYGLHMGRFSQPILRVLYFLSGVGGAFMVATGLVLWTVKRRPSPLDGKGAGFGHALVEGLNAGAILGVPTAMAGFFWANRLLPLGMAQRGEWESRTFLIVLGLMIAFSLLRPIRRRWVEGAVIAAAAFGLLPVINALTTDRGLIASLAAGDWGMAGMDLTFLGLAGMFGWIALRVSKAPRGKPVKKRNRLDIALEGAE